MLVSPDVSVYEDDSLVNVFDGLDTDIELIVVVMRLVVDCEILMELVLVENVSVNTNVEVSIDVGIVLMLESELVISVSSVLVNDIVVVGVISEVMDETV